MPAPTIRCEFCENHEMRRDAYASHVKAKHTKDIARLLLEDLKEYEIHAIGAYAQEHSTKYMVIQSKLYQDAEYWFGVKPYFYIRESIEKPYDPERPDTKLKPYPEDDELRQYLSREENLVAHRKFMEEVLQSISLLDFIQIGKDLKIKNPDVLNMKKELSSLRENYKALEVSSQNQVEQLKRELEMWKETADEKECIADLRRDLQSARSHVRQLEKSNSLIKEEIEFLKKEHQDQWSGFNQSRFISDRDAMERDERKDKKFNDLNTKFEKYKCDRAVDDANLVQKTLEKERETVRKALEKEREAKQKIKDKKALDKLKAKKKAKQAKKMAEMSDSDSESDSDSD